MLYTINIVPSFLVILVHFSRDKSPAHFDYKPQNLNMNIFNIVNPWETLAYMYYIMYHAWLQP